MKRAIFRRIPQPFLNFILRRDDLHSVSETAKMLDKDAKTIYYHIKVGHLTTIKRYGLLLVKGESIRKLQEKK